MMSILTTSIQHFTGDPRHCGKSRKRNRRHQIGKKEIKLSIEKSNEILKTVTITNMYN